MKEDFDEDLDEDLDAGRLEYVNEFLGRIIFGLSIIERRQKQISRPSSCVRKPFPFASYLR